MHSELAGDCSSANLQPVLAVVGPTGSGKSQLSLFLAEELDGEIVNCDSVQVYRELNIGSAKLPPSERAGIPHHLLDILSFKESLTAGAYARLARRAISDIHSRGKLPIVAGGTGFYVRALFEGLSPAPSRDPELRRCLAERESQCAGVLHRLLRWLHPPAAARIHPRDIQKLIRAIEMSSRGTPPEELPRQAINGVRLLKIGLRPKREELRQRLLERTEAMFQAGLIEETRQLLAGTSRPIPSSLSSLGYRQAASVVLDSCPVETAIAQTYIKTCQYAKRQTTWFRGDHSIRWIDFFGTQWSAQQVALDWSTEFLRTTPDNSS